MQEFDSGAVRRTYDAVADEYAATFGDDLRHNRFDRRFLDEAIRRLPRSGPPVIDLGCGPAQVARYLMHAGVPAIGIDLAPRALALCRERDAAPALLAGDMRRLPIRTSTCAGVAAFYSVHHVPRTTLPAVLDEIHRVLVRDGLLLLATHLGTGVIVSDREWLGHHVEPLLATLYDRSELQGVLERCAFTIVISQERGPLPHEYPSERVYLAARAG